jgi:hypothetical protein
MTRSPHPALQRGSKPRPPLRLAVPNLGMERLREAISWALGEGDSNFGDNIPKNAPRYWWRRELRRRAALAQRGEES